MNLVKFLLLISISLILLGAFGHYPFGASVTAVSLTDVGVLLTLTFFAIWKVSKKETIFLPKSFIWLSFFILVAVVSWLLSWRIFLPFDTMLGGLYLFRFILYSLTMVVAFNLLKAKTLNLEQLINFLIRVGVVFSLLGFIQLLLFSDFTKLADFGFDPHQGRLAATFLDPNFAGAFLTFVFGLVFFKYISSGKKLWLGWCGWFLVVIALTYSRSAYLMLTVFVIFLGLIKWRKLLIFMVIISVLTYALVPRIQQRVQGALTLDKTANERIKSWQVGTEVFLKEPLLGVGFNNLRLAQSQLNLFRSQTINGGASGAGVDSGFILVLATTGVIGLFFYLLFWSKTLKELYPFTKLSKLIFFGLLLAFIIDGQLINSLFYPYFMVLYFPILGLLDD